MTRLQVRQNENFYHSGKEVMCRNPRNGVKAMRSWSPAGRYQDIKLLSKLKKHYQMIFRSFLIEVIASKVRGWTFYLIRVSA